VAVLEMVEGRELRRKEAHQC